MRPTRLQVLPCTTRVDLARLNLNCALAHRASCSEVSYGRLAEFRQSPRPSRLAVRSVIVDIPEAAETSDLL